MADPLEALASLYYHKGQTNVSLPLYKRALAIREKSIGLSDPQLLSTLRNYHNLLMSEGRREEAIEITDRIERIQKPLP